MIDLATPARTYLEGNLVKHRTNVQLILRGSVSVAEHPDIMETLEGELAKVSHYMDLISALDECEYHLD